MRNFGLKVGIVGAAGFEQRVRDRVLDLPFRGRRGVAAAGGALGTEDATGQGPVVALTYRTCVDNPAGSGDRSETMRVGRVSRCDGAMMRAALYEAVPSCY